MKIVTTLHNKALLYEYQSMGIDTFVLPTVYSSGSTQALSLEDISSIIDTYPKCSFYIMMNAIYGEDELIDIRQFIDRIAALKIKGILFQDFAIVNIVEDKNYSFDMMYAPETLNTNSKSLQTLKNYGVTSAFLSRVIPLEEQILIQEKTTIPLMLQVHGVEYVAASKRHLIENYQEATQLDFNVDSRNLKIKAHQSDLEFHIYEDQRGTHIYTHTRLYMLDLFNQIKDFEYIYIETLFMEPNEALEVCSLYSDALKAYHNGRYNQYVGEYVSLLKKLNTPLDRGFTFDQTVYKLEDMRKRDEKENQ